MASTSARRFVLVDRDGTINVERHYLSDPDRLELLPNAAAGLRRMADMGLGIVVITNQSGLARGYFDEAALTAVHGRLEAVLATKGVRVDAILHCPHGPDDGCACRKPAPGLAEEAARRFGFDPGACFVVGDKAADVEMGRRLGAVTILTTTGYGRDDWQGRRAWPDFVVPDLLAAADMIEGFMKERPETPSGLGGDATERVRRHLLGSIETKRRLLDECEPAILAAAALVTEALRAGGKLMICGNGGSAADSQHIAAEFVSTLDHAFPRPALPAIALTTDTSLLTANANDFGFEGVFERQVQALGRPGDVLMGISTSGESANVVRAMACARDRGIATLALTGGAGGRLVGLADVSVVVPSRSVQHIQEAHIAIGHLICELAERSLFPAGSASGGGSETPVA